MTDFTAIALQIIHGTGGDPKRKEEAADILKAAFADVEATLFKLNSGEELQSLMKLNNDLRKQLVKCRAALKPFAEIAMREIPDNCEKCGCKLGGEAAHIDDMDDVWRHSCADNAAECAALSSRSPSVDGQTLPTVSAMRTALGYMRSQAQELEKLVRTVSGSGEGAEIYRDAVKCIEAALSSRSEAPVAGERLELAAAMAAHHRNSNGKFVFSFSKAYRDLIVAALRAAPSPDTRVREALEAINAAHASLFAQCCSNPISNAWGQEVDVSLINEANRLANIALTAPPLNPTCKFDHPGSQTFTAVKCSECDQDLADLPSKLCPGCQAYREHQR